MFFRGVDDGTEFNALTLDMSAGGNASFAGNVSLGDSKELRLGASDDLVIKHNGTNSVVDNTTGDLIIQNQIADGDIIFKSDDGSDGLAEYFRIDGGSVKNIASKELQFFDNVKVNEENETLRKNRLELINMLCKTFQNFINFQLLKASNE